MLTSALEKKEKLHRLTRFPGKTSIRHALLFKMTGLRSYIFHTTPAVRHLALKGYKKVRSPKKTCLSSNLRWRDGKERTEGVTSLIFYYLVAIATRQLSGARWTKWEKNKSAPGIPPLVKFKELQNQLLPLRIQKQRWGIVSNFNHITMPLRHNDRIPV